MKSGKHSIATTEEFKFKDVGDKKSVLLEAHDDLWDHNLKKLSLEELLPNNSSHENPPLAVFWDLFTQNVMLDTNTK